MNPGLAVRHPACFVCLHVAHVEHITVLLFNEDGTPKRKGNGYVLRPAMDYLESLGHEDHSKRRGVSTARVKAHLRHVLASVTSPDVVPLDVEERGVTRLSPQGPTGWLDLQQQGMNVGMDALRIVGARLEMMEDKDLIAVAKLGAVVAGTRANLEAKGRQIQQVDVLLRLAAGVRPDG